MPIVTGNAGGAMQIGGVMRVRLVTATPDQTAAEAIRAMLDAGVGSVVVCEDNAPVGIFTERDVLKLAGIGAGFGSVVLRDVMTPNPLTITAEDSILAAAQLMGERSLRHLPVVEGGNLVGIVSIRDVLGYLAERLWSDHDEAARDTARALLHNSKS
ncbi:MAG TPA: CBS domain-containing protein [Gaiellaceae bacterium]|nr:CBS domain-containing protein [Gaiellaceae bacterium]